MRCLGSTSGQHAVERHRQQDNHEAQHQHRQDHAVPPHVIQSLFDALYCATLPEDLIEAALFGYAPGAFSGARKEGYPGRIRAAHGGTLFLDEIGDLPLVRRPSCCACCRNGRWNRWQFQVAPVDVRVIAATNRDLATEVQAGRFRADLYYRLNGLTLMLPALRERSDFIALTTRMLREMAPGRGVVLETAVAAAFADYAWPGNLRQLANALRTACALLDEGEARIGWRRLPDDLLEELRRPSTRVVLRRPRRSRQRTCRNFRKPRWIVPSSRAAATCRKQRDV